MNISNRLKRVISDKGCSVYQFEKSIGESNGYVHHLKNNISSDKLQKILELFPNLNIEWLLLGGGEMLKSEAPDSVVSESEYPYHNETTEKNAIIHYQKEIMTLQKKFI